jgi:tetratricopeptide (TPR) repeat protein
MKDLSSFAFYITFCKRGLSNERTIDYTFVEMPRKKASRKSKGPSLPGRVVDGLYEAERLLDEGQPQEALQILEDLDDPTRAPRGPDLVPVLELLVNAYADLKDMHGYEWAIYRLLKIDQSEPDAVLGMAGAYMSNLRPAMAIQAFQRFLRCGPEHERAAEVRETLVRIQAALQEETSELNLPENEAFDLALQNEEVRFFMDHRQLHAARQAAEKLLQKHPAFVPAINNLSQIHAVQGEMEQAIDLARKVLEIAPDNVHALSNLARLLFITGRYAEATTMAQRLKDSQAPAADLWTKKAEALAYLADHEGLLELYQQAREADKTVEESALFLHLVAVAMYNQGREGQARRLWRRALKAEPAFKLARQNLDDLDQPIGERNAPWAFSLPYWISEKTIRELYLTFKTASRREAAARSEAGKFLKRHPEIISLAPHLLAHGDAACREIVLNLAGATQDAAFLEALKVFALGQRGADDLRMQAAQLLVENDMLPPGSVRLWLEGEWKDVLLLNFEVTPEAEERNPNPRVQSLAEKAIYALQDRDGRRAQELLEQAIALDPELPSLQNNLGVAYELQGQAEKAHAMVREIHERFPDYLFGVTGVAMLAVREGDVETAHKLLNGLLTRKQLHVAEFDALCAAQIEVFLAEKNREAARSWFELWEQIEPENPKLDSYRWRVGKASPDSHFKRRAGS